MVNDVDISGLGSGETIITTGANTGDTTLDEKGKAEAEEARLLAETEKADKEKADKLALEMLEAAKIKDLPVEELVEIEGIKYKIDPNGNAVDDKGTVFKTKEQLSEMESADEIPLVQVIIQKSGYIPLDDKGKPKVYEDSEDGVIEANLDIARMMASKEREDLIKSDPEFEEFIEYRKRGGTLEDFANKKANSWRSIKLDKTNEAQLMDIVIADLVAGGQDIDQAKLTAELYKDTKKLPEFGEKAYQRLTTNEDVEEKQQQEVFKKQQEEYFENAKKHWDNIKEVIKKGTLHSVIIPEIDKEPFFEYISKNADGKGNSQSVLERSKIPTEQLLQLEYLQFKKFDISKLIQTAVKSQNARSLREKINRSKTSGAGGGDGIDRSQYNKPTTGVPDSLTLDAVIT